MNISCPVGWVMTCSTLRDPICHILWPFYSVFWPKMGILGHKQSQQPKMGWTWLNIVFHIWGGWFGVWTFWTNQKWQLRATPKIGLFGPKWPIPNELNIGWTWWSNIVFHIRGGLYNVLTLLLAHIFLGGCWHQKVVADFGFKRPKSH